MLFCKVSGMFSISSWMLTIAGASLIVSLLNIVMPSGRMGYFCSGIVNIIYVYIVFLPVLYFINSVF